MPPLDASFLPALPQVPFLTDILTDLWQDPGVLCIWLTGSLARGDADPYSDVDLGIALQPAAFQPEHLPASAKRLGARAIVHTMAAMSEHATLHQLLLADGTSYDFMVQTTRHPLRPQHRLVLACRDAAFATLLASYGDSPFQPQPADPQGMRELLTTFWLAQLRQHMVLHRDLVLMAWAGEQRMRHDLLRLWYVAITGTDCGPLERLSMHTLKPVTQAVRAAMGDRALAFIGQPLQSRHELLAASAHLRGEVARVGRQLATQLGFHYPTAIETTVLRRWAELPMKEQPTED